MSRRERKGKDCRNKIASQREKKEKDPLKRLKERGNYFNPCQS